MILRNKKTHYEVEMFHIVNISKDHPTEAFFEYLKTVAKEFDKELNTTLYSMATNTPKVDATSSHHIITE